MKKGFALTAQVPVLIFLSLASLTGHTRSGTPQIALSHQARSLQPGEIVLLTVRCPAELESVQASAFDKEISFFPTEDALVWQGLVGIDLQTSAGEYLVKVRATTKEGGAVEASHRLLVRGKEFPVRRLTVSKEFVTPPEEVLERIGREARRVLAIFKTVSGKKLWKGSFSPPVPGKATSSFGKRSILNGQVRSPHTGTDFRAGKGTPVKAPNAGKVVLVTNLYFSGNTVILDHGLGLYSYFAHLSGFTVEEGDTVSGGNLIGYVGATGRVTGPHLHWTVRLTEARVDALSLLYLLQTGLGVCAVERIVARNRGQIFKILR